MNKYELIDQASNTVYNWLKNAEGSAFETVTVDRGELETLKRQLNELELKMGNFIDDYEKMHDFRVLSKDEFLASYSYIFEDEYDNTKVIYNARRFPSVKKSLEEELKENTKLEDAIKRMPSTTTRLGNSVYHDIDLQGENFVYLFTVQEAYGDRSYYQDKETGELYNEWFSIGD